MEGVRVLLQVVCALSVASFATAQIAIDVNYPAVENRSLVNLTCKMIGGPIPLGGAQFLKDGVLLTQGPASDQVSTIITSEGDGEVMFIFTQAQEGSFRCSAKGQTSPAIALAGTCSDSSGYL